MATSLLIVPGRPTESGLTWWCLHPTSATPPALSAEGPGVANSQTTIHPFPAPSLAGLGLSAALAVTTGLLADSPYTLRVTLAAQSASVRSRTLPRELPAQGNFTIAFGSCYCFARDKNGRNGPDGENGAALSLFYPPKLHATEFDPVRLRFLCGDQVYLDLRPDGDASFFLEDAPRPWQLYANQWRHPQFSPFLAASPNVMLADDHEFWNDYPHQNIWQGWNRGEEGVRLAREMDQGFEVFQASLNLDPATGAAATPATLSQTLQGTARTFQFGVAPLEFFILDVRTLRSRYDGTNPEFTPQVWLERALQWLANLQGPGVLVISQPMVEEPAGAFARWAHTMGDVNLPDYGRQFARLWEAIFAAPHSVLILSGDIHYSRLCYVSQPGGTGSAIRVYEAISSPLQRIPAHAHDSEDDSPSDKLKWDDDRRQTNFYRVYESDSPAGYATISFSRFGGETSRTVKAEISWWGEGFPNQREAARLRTEIIYLS